MNIKKCLRLLGPKTEWNPAPTEKQITRASRGNVFLVILTLSVVTFWAMLTRGAIYHWIDYWSFNLFTWGAWAVTIWASYCAVVEVSSMKIARESANLAEHLRKYENLPEDPLSPLQDLEA